MMNSLNALKSLNVPKIFHPRSLALKLFGALTFALITNVAGVNLSVAQQGAKPPTVVELYTSQGCHSCPPADALLGTLASRPDIIALSFHVDYWDYLGWKDPYGSPEATTRQRGYGRTMGLRTIYTPQMIIDGEFQFVGSRPNELATAMGQSQNNPKRRVLLSSPSSRTVRLPQAAVSSAHDIWYVAYDAHNVTDIKRGENANKRLGYTNSVRVLKHLGQWQGQAGDVALPAAKMGDGEVILVQEPNQGAIIGSLLVPNQVAG